jgi:hypothetical protein
MKRMVLALLAALSGMACVLLGITWGASYFNNPTFAAMSTNGGVFQEPRDCGLLLMPGWVGLCADQRTGANPVYLIAVPYWLPVLITAIMPSWWVALQRRRRLRAWRSRAGLCVSCGYDLTGNTSGVCPECGNNIDVPATN